MNDDVMWSLILAMPTVTASVLVLVLGPVALVVWRLVQRRRARRK